MNSQSKCIHLAGGGCCKILRVESCKGHCSFYREEREADASRTLWQQRLNGLEPEVQSKIAGTYFGGKMPWKERRNNDQSK
ncbi:MAG: hypothetical protein IJ043_08900 [Clostridia bacterium]|nr:hypothetical protein [Clostridia bacterium]